MAELIINFKTKSVKINWIYINKSIQKRWKLQLFIKIES